MQVHAPCTETSSVQPALAPTFRVLAALFDCGMRGLQGCSVTRST